MQIINLKPKLVSFKDFSKYSVVNANKYGVYDELITHETENQTSREIVENTIALFYLKEGKRSIEYFERSLKINPKL